jgi:arginyl-tRNA synthetase
MTVSETLAENVAQVLSELDLHLDSVRFERPARPEHGDLSTNAALVAAKSAGRNPRDLAAVLVERLSAIALPHVNAIEVAGPGFVDFRLADSWLHEALKDVLVAGEDRYAAPQLGHGERVQIEFVSANPTGPLHVGNGWFGCYGDALARLLSRCGWIVEREYYVNDTGNQIRMLGESLLAREHSQHARSARHRVRPVVQPGLDRGKWQGR